MLFTRMASLLAFPLAFASFALAKPIIGILEQSDETSVQNVLKTLKSKTDVVLPNMSKMTAGGNITDGSIGELVSELVSALTTAKGSLDLIGVVTSNATGDSTIPDLAAEVIGEIAEALNGATVLTDLTDLLAEVDVALSELLTGLDLVLVGVLTLVDALITSLSEILGDLGLVTTLGVLGL